MLKVLTEVRTYQEKRALGEHPLELGGASSLGGLASEDLVDRLMRKDRLYPRLISYESGKG